MVDNDVTAASGTCAAARAASPSSSDPARIHRTARHPSSHPPAPSANSARTASRLRRPPRLAGARGDNRLCSCRRREGQGSRAVCSQPACRPRQRGQSEGGAAPPAAGRRPCATPPAARRAARAARRRAAAACAAAARAAAPRARTSPPPPRSPSAAATHPTAPHPPRRPGSKAAESFAGHAKTVAASLPRLATAAGSHATSALRARSVLPSGCWVCRSERTACLGGSSTTATLATVVASRRGCAPAIPGNNGPASVQAGSNGRRMAGSLPLPRPSRSACRGWPNPRVTSPRPPPPAGTTRAGCSDPAPRRSTAAAAATRG